LPSGRDIDIISFSVLLCQDKIMTQKPIEVAIELIRNNSINDRTYLLKHFDEITKILGAPTSWLSKLKFESLELNNKIEECKKVILQGYKRVENSIITNFIHHILSEEEFTQFINSIKTLVNN
jgi:predicted metallo-beta-lactamase superfamily hydrolase